MAKKLKMEEAMQQILSIDPTYEISIVVHLGKDYEYLYEVEIYEWTTTGDIDSNSVAESIKPTIKEAILDCLQQLQQKGN